MKFIHYVIMFFLLSSFVLAVPIDSRTDCNGNVCTQHSNIINYLNPEGNYETINNQIVISDYPNYDYEMEKAGYKAYFKSDPTSGQVVKFIKDGEEINFQPMTLNYRNNLDQIQQISVINSSNGISQDNNFKYVNAYGTGIDLIYNTQPQFLKEELVINSFNNLINPEAYIISGGNTTLDLDFILSTDSKLFIEGVEWDKKTSISTSNNVVVKDDLGNVLYEFYPPLAYDSNGSFQQLEYSFKKSGSSLYVIVKTPYSWLENAIYPVTIDPTVGFTTAGTGSNDASIGTDAWSSPSFATNCASSYAEVYMDSSTSISNYLKATNFGFSVPTGSTIDGVRVRVKKYYIEDYRTPTVIDHSIKLVVGGSITGNDKSVGTEWSLDSPRTDTYGGVADTWGLSLTDSDVNAADFGFVISGDNVDSDDSISYANCMQIELTYTISVDSIYPFFTSIVDNQGDFNDFGYVDINYTVNNTNGTFGLVFDGVNKTCNNLTGLVGNSTTVNCNFYQGASGSFSYYAWALGSGGSNNYNQSTTQNYVIPESNESAIHNFTASSGVDVLSFFWITNKFKSYFDTDIYGLRNFDVTGTVILRNNVTLTDFIGGSSFVKSNPTTGQLSTAEIQLSDLPTIIVNSTSWNRSGTNVFLANTGDGVGVGTSSPSEKVEVAGSVLINDGTNNQAYIMNRGGSEIWRISGANYDLSLDSVSDIRIDAGTKSNAVFVQANTGYVGINNTSPATNLEVEGVGGLTNGVILISDSADGDFTHIDPNYGLTFSRGTSYINNRLVGGDIVFRTSLSSVIDTTAMTILDTGDVGIGSSPSTGYRLHVTEGNVKSDFGNPTMFVGYDDGSNWEGNIKIGQMQIYSSSQDDGGNPITSPAGLVIQTELNPGRPENYSILQVRSSGDANRFTAIHGNAGFASQFYDSLAVGASGYTECSKMGVSAIDCGTGSGGDLFVKDDIELDGNLTAGVDVCIEGGACLSSVSGGGGGTINGTVWNKTSHLIWANAPVSIGKSTSSGGQLGVNGDFIFHSSTTTINRTVGIQTSSSTVNQNLELIPGLGDDGSDIQPGDIYIQGLEGDCTGALCSEEGSDIYLRAGASAGLLDGGDIEISGGTGGIGQGQVDIKGGKINLVSQGSVFGSTLNYNMINLTADNVRVYGNLTLENGFLIGRQPMIELTSSDTTTFTSTAAQLGWNVTKIHDTEYFGWSEDDKNVSLKVNGYYKVEWSIPIDVFSGTARSTALCYLIQDGSINFISGSTSYQRIAGGGDQGNDNQFIINVTNAPENLGTYCQRLTGTDTLYYQSNFFTGTFPTMILTYVGEKS